MTKQAKIGWLYTIAALFVAISLFFLVKKSTYLFFAVPLVLGILLLYIFSLDKVMLLISFLVPLSVSLEEFDQLAISLPDEPLLLGLTILFLAKLLYDGKYDKKITHHRVSIVIFCMLIWMVVTTITSDIPVVSIKFIASRLWFIIPGFFFCIILFRKSKNIDWFIWLYIASLIIVIVYTIYNHAKTGFDGDAAHWVMTPFYNDHTAYGAALAMYLILAVSYAFVPGISKTKRLIIIGCVCILSVALILSNCRAAWISVIAAVCALACVLLKIKFRLIVTIFAIMVGLFFAFQNQIITVLERNNQDASGNFTENIKSITNITTDASNLERINRWQSALRLFKERPVFGWGPGTYQFVYAPYQMSKEKTIISTNAGDGGNAHSEYIGAMAEQGLVGSLMVVLLVVMVIYTGLKTYQRAKNKKAKILALGATLAFFSYFLHGMLNNFLDTEKLAIPVWSCAALIVAIDIYYADKESFTDVVETKDEEKPNP